MPETATLQDRLDALTHKLLHKQLGQVQVNAADIIGGTVGGAVLVPAGNVVAGTFRAGNFVFPNNLIVSGRFEAWNGQGTTPFVVGGGGAVELGRYLDFHSSGNAAEANDYDIRLQAPSADELLLEGGVFTIDAAAKMGKGTFYGDYAAFSHATKYAAGQYALLQGAGGDTYLNAYNSPVRLRINNTDHLDVRDDWIYDFHGNSGSWDIGAGVRARIWGDGEFWCQSIGIGGDNGDNAGIWCNNGMFLAKVAMMGEHTTHTNHAYFCHANRRATTEGYGFLHRYDGYCWVSSTGDITFNVASGANSVTMNSDSTTQHYRFDQIGGWDTGACRTKSSGGGTGAKYSYWSAGQNAAHIHKCWGSSIEVRTWDDVGWGYSVGDFNDVCTMRAKIPESVERLELKLTKADRKTKIKKIKPVKYKRPLEDACVNCLATGLKVRNLNLPVEERAPIIAAGLLSGNVDVPCPDCNGTGRKVPDKSAQKNYDTGYIGFIAEEIAEEFPEAIWFDMEEKPTAMKAAALIALLWEEVKDLEERLDSVERLPVVALNKPAGSPNA